MNEKGKMIEVIKQCRSDWRRSPPNTNPDAMLADRLIAAGFGLVKKTEDLAKRKIVQPHELLEMVRLGIKPILVCNKNVEDRGIDSPWELGMYARVKSVSYSSMGDEGLEIILDLSEFSDINDGMASHDWYRKDGRGMGTCKEAGWWKPEDTIWVPVDGFDMEMME